MILEIAEKQNNSDFLCPHFNELSAYCFGGDLWIFAVNSEYEQSST